MALPAAPDEADPECEAEATPLEESARGGAQNGSFVRLPRKFAAGYHTIAARDNHSRGSKSRLGTRWAR